MKLSEYWDELNRHDWYYMYSDDSRAYRNGSENESRLARIAKESPEHAELWEGFGKHHFTGKAWRTEQLPKPKRPVDPEPIEFCSVEGGVWLSIDRMPPRLPPHALRWEDGRVWDVHNGWRS